MRARNGRHTQLEGEREREKEEWERREGPVTRRSEEWSTETSKTNGCKHVLVVRVRSTCLQYQLTCAGHVSALERLYARPTWWQQTRLLESEGKIIEMVPTGFELAEGLGFLSGADVTLSGTRPTHDRTERKERIMVFEASSSKPTCAFSCETFFFLKPGFVLDLA